MRHERMWMSGSALTIMCGLFVAPCAAKVVQVGTPEYPDLAAAIAAVPTIRQGLAAGEPVEIDLPPGAQRLTEAVTIDAAHGGTSTSPLIIKGVPGGNSRLVGTVILRGQPVRPDEIPPGRSPAGVLAVDLSDTSSPAHIVARGAVLSVPAAGFEMFQGASLLTPSRWPSQGYATAKTSGSGSDGIAAEIPGSHAAGWTAEPDAWVGGYWSADWAYELEPMQSVSSDGSSITIGPMTDKRPVRPLSRLFVENLLSELKVPGTYVLQPKRKLVLFIPSIAGDPNVEVAVATTLLSIRNAQNVQVRDIGFDRSLGPAILVSGGSNIGFVHCAIRQTGGNGVVVSGGDHVVFQNSVIADTAERGIILSGGNRSTLQPASHAFIGGLITDFGLESPSYRPGIELAGVGNKVTGTVISGGDHNAVMLSGNDLEVSGNEIANVLRDTDDAGAIYMGNDWTQRGVVVSGNYIHNLGSPGRPVKFLSGVYLDDQFSGARVTGNVIVGGQYGVVIGGGRDNVVGNNLFVRPSMGGVHFDDRGRNIQKAAAQHALPAKMASVPAMGPLWLHRYPAMGSLAKGDYGDPVGNVVEDNVTLGAPVIVTDRSGLTDIVTTRGNDERAAPSMDSATDLGRIGRSYAQLRGMPPIANLSAVVASLGGMRAVPSR